MPIYEYVCRKCGEQFEVLVRVSGDLPCKCSRCGASNPDKVFSAFAVGESSVSTPVGECTTCSTAGSGKCSPRACPYGG